MSTGLTTSSPVSLPVLLFMFRSVHSVPFALLSLAVIRFLLLESSALLMDIVACCIPPHCPSYFSFLSCVSQCISPCPLPVRTVVEACKQSKMSHREAAEEHHIRPFA
ncbi:hypothetical protein OH76DRAFT_335666 [Lentinus brumalis]|uniref:Uncharacterized protein n=1 Tax=Lentinus brumalis TaxID=2498619 RepID=A0A371CJL1_9APHY|nr:hypothetical protein OH76DRAFT_335666 [Polyporus brumalis]